MTKETPTPAAGSILGRYRVVSELGRGGMGVVYSCVDEPLSRRVAVKTLSVGLLGRDREARMRRFQREVQALAQLDHAGILHIYDAGEADDPVVGWVLYYAMELIEGETLSERLIRNGAMEQAQACAVVAKCAEALGTAHTRGIVHRDVKPANIFLAGRGRVVVADFGVCKIEGGTEITRKDQMVGTPSYLAPEQILGLPVDPRTDVFALGALLYVLITNSALRPQLDRAGLSRLAATDDAAMRARAIQGAPRGLPDIIARALARDPKDRFASGSELAEALEKFIGKVPDPFEQPGEQARPNPRQVPSLGNTLSGAFTDAGSDSGDGAAAANTQAVGGDTLADGAEPTGMPPAQNTMDDEPATAPVRAQADAMEPPPTTVEKTDPPVVPAGPAFKLVPRPGAAPPESAKALPVSRSSSAHALVPPTPDAPPAPPPAPTATPPPIAASPPAASPPSPVETRRAENPPGQTVDEPLPDRTDEEPVPVVSPSRPLPRANVARRQRIQIISGAIVAGMAVGGLAALVATRPGPTTTATTVATAPPVAPVVPAPTPDPPPLPAVCTQAANTSIPREVAARVEAAQAADRKGDVTRAVAAWQQVVDSDAREPAHHLGLGRALVKAGDPTAARPHLECAARLDATRPEARLAEEELAKLPAALSRKVP